MNIRQIFINSVGRLRSGWRVLIFAVLYLVVLFVLSTGARVFYAIAVRVAPSRSINEFLQNLIYRCVMLAAALIAGYICARWLEGLPWRSLGVGLHARWLRHFLVGSAVGIASLALAAAIATAGGGLSFQLTSRALLLGVVQTLVLTAILFVVAALAEEALCRGYPLQTMARANLAVIGIILTSIWFASGHLLNPNFEYGLPFVNLLLAGVWFSVAFLRSRSLWFPLGIHWAWNWALGSLFGLPVSGIDKIAPYPVMRGTDLGPAWLTGGDFGIEGGIACTVAILISTIIMWRLRLVTPTEEMVKLTSQENPLIRLTH
ncbi:MAG TPA: CPBP family intramembrane glutamic endopeptidase [Pyrinomonadaceae bacterium]|nr:CPBP family intramembrane glutamic endopeptidase [Pyrinomonadaceae bacterium]